MKTQSKEVYRCSTCGGVVEVLHPGANMVCCGNPMTLLKGLSRNLVGIGRRCS